MGLLSQFRDVSSKGYLHSAPVYSGINECGHSSQGVGVVKSLELIGSGPVGLVHTRKAGIKYKKPTSPNSWYPRDIGLAISAHSAPSV